MSHAARRWISLILIAGILIVDLGLRWHGRSFMARAMLDEPCHQATGLICLGAITRFLGRAPTPAFGWAMIIGSNAIDVDHLPLEFGSPVLTAGTPRPHTHALWTVLVLTVAALAARRFSRRAGTPAFAASACVLLGAACGLFAHFLRDIGTAQMSLWWPITDAALEIPYWWYLAAIVVIAVIPMPVTRKRGWGQRGGACGLGCDFAWQPTHYQKSC